MQTSQNDAVCHCVEKIEWNDDVLNESNVMSYLSMIASNCNTAFFFAKCNERNKYELFATNLT